MQNRSTKQSFHATKCSENFFGTKIICFNNNWMKHRPNVCVSLHGIDEHSTFLENGAFFSNHQFVNQQKCWRTRTRFNNEFYIKSWTFCEIGVCLLYRWHSLPDNSCVLWKHSVDVVTSKAMGHIRIAIVVARWARERERERASERLQKRFKTKRTK